MGRKSSSLASSAFYVTLIILFSKGIGFVREMIMAAVYGDGRVQFSLQPFLQPCSAVLVLYYIYTRSAVYALPT